MIINFANQELILLKDGAIFWPKTESIILGDLHLEKGSFFAMKGNFLPPYDSIDTLRKLSDIAKKNRVNKIFLLGDIFHDKSGIERLEKNAKELFSNICRSYDIKWILGNHDGNTAFTKQIFNKYTFKNISFVHKAEFTDEFEISGHFHPKVSYSYKTKRLSNPCFLINDKKIIMPAFGSYAGGLDIKSEVIQKLLVNFEVFMLGANNVVRLNKNKIL